MMPHIHEAMAPWLGAAFVLAVVFLTMVMRGNELPVLERTTLLVGLGATLAAGGLVSARSNRERRARDREERARPATEELVDPPTDVRSTSYVQGMERWITAMLELTEHAVSVTEPGTPTRTYLGAAVAETRDLRELFDVDATEKLTINDHARLHALGSLWEAGQPRLEYLAAEADAAWHRLWRARSVVARRLRHGRTPPLPLVLPYRR
jgi:hypothetical protein